MNDEPATNEKRMFEELQELVSMEMKDIMSTAAEEGYSPRDVVTALEFALQAEIELLAASPEAEQNIAGDGEPAPPAA